LNFIVVANQWLFCDIHLGCDTDLTRDLGGNPGPYMDKGPEEFIKCLAFQASDFKIMGGGTHVKLRDYYINSGSQQTSCFAIITPIVQ
jgi:hypothetical protein